MHEVHAELPRHYIGTSCSWFSHTRYNAQSRYPTLDAGACRHRKARMLPLNPKNPALSISPYVVLGRN